MGWWCLDHFVCDQSILIKNKRRAFSFLSLSSSLFTLSWELETHLSPTLFQSLEQHGLYYRTTSLIKTLGERGRVRSSLWPYSQLLQTTTGPKQSQWPNALNAVLTHGPSTVKCHILNIQLWNFHEEKEKIFFGIDLIFTQARTHNGIQHNSCHYKADIL